LEQVRARLRAEVPMLDADRHLAPDIEKAIALVRSGKIAALGAELLPTISGA
jgi:histidine ammonia-lyase